MARVMSIPLAKRIALEEVLRDLVDHIEPEAGECGGVGENGCQCECHYHVIDTEAFLTRIAEVFEVKP